MSILNNPNHTYNGNPLLKGSGVPFNWTPEMKAEYIRCRDDIVYFAENYVKIVNLDEGFVKIRLYDFQKEIIRKYTKTRRLISTQSRQSGKTTVVTIIILHFAIFSEYKEAALLANKAATAIEILDRIKRAYEALPAWLQSGVITWNKGSIEFENGCKVTAAATSSSAIRGKSIFLLYLDERRFIDNFQDFLASVLPTISSGKQSKIIMTSTPNGLNTYAKIWEEAKAGLNGYDWIEVPWWEVPGRDEEWAKETLASLSFDQEKFNQEYCCEFMGSSGTLINGNALKSIILKIPVHDKDNFKVYIEPGLNQKYAMTVDVSQGKGLDHSTIQVIDITEMPYKQVATYRSNLVTGGDFAEIVYRISKIYNEATILIELNDAGILVADYLYNDYECENLIWTENGGARGKRISAGGKGSEMGVRVSKSVKGIGCTVLKLLIEQQQLIICDHETLEELSRFSKKGNSYEAEKGYHDDLVMPLVIFAWMTDQQYFKELTDINTLHQLRDQKDNEIENSLVGMGFAAFETGDDYSSFEETSYDYFGNETQVLHNF